MRIKTLTLIWAVALAARAVGQAPPNDNFTNRISLIGSPVMWTGNTVGATEDLSTDLDLMMPNVYAWSGKSAWWSWVASDSSPATIEVLGGFVPLSGFLAVYSLNPGERGPPLCFIDLSLHGQYATYNAQAGREYQIRMNSDDTNDVVFRLTATNAPVFRLQPRTQTVSSNTSALFSAWAIGTQPLQYQWRYAGTDLPGATNAMFPISSASATNAGEYCVVVSSAAGGVSTSAVARLAISTNDPLPSVKAIRSIGHTNFEFVVNGEEGRSYLVETSTNLADWPTPQIRLVVINTNQTTPFQIAQDAPGKFFCFSPYHPKNELCNSNLKELWFASWQFAEDQHQPPLRAITQVDLLTYSIDHAWPHCPLNPEPFPTDYVAMNLNYPVYCAYGHYLEER